MGKHREALQYARVAKDIFEVLNDGSRLMQIDNLMGISFFYAGCYDIALYHLFRARLNAVFLKKFRKVTAILNNVGEVYRKQGQLEKAMSHYEEGARLVKEHGYFEQYGALLSNMAEIYFEEENYNEAEKLLMEAKSYFDASDDIIFKTEWLYKLGKIYMAQKKLSEARIYLDQAEIGLTKIDNKYYAVDVLLLQYEWQIKQNDSILENALDKLIEAKKIALENAAEHQLIKIYDVMCQHYENQNDYKAAFNLLKEKQGIEKKLNTKNEIEKMSILINEVEFGSEIERDSQCEILEFIKRELIYRKCEAELLGN